MPRKPRVYFPGAFFHVIARGNNRQSIYADRQDFEMFLRSLTVTQERYPFALSRARALLVYFAVYYARHPMSHVARFLQLHSSSITKALRRAKKDLEKDPSRVKIILQSLSHKSKNQD